jgi:divinyl protochlorophyllide a 8-vinyl-reductase
MHATHAASGTARIGPNALIQTVTALREARGAPAADAFLKGVGRGDLVTAPPTTMVEESEFIALINALRAAYGVEETGTILARSGELTAAYLLANRIPGPAHMLLPLLPRGLALQILLKAVGAHAWTFAGSGRFSFKVGADCTRLRLADCAECRGMVAREPLCRYYEHCFQSLLRPLIDRRLVVRETSCAASGADSCVFEVTWP